MKINLRLLYLYLFSFIGLLVCIIGSVQLVDLGIKVYIFKGADRFDNFVTPTKVDPNGKEVVLSEKEKEEQKKQQEIETQRQRQRQASTALAMLIVGAPVYLYHWNTIQKENKR